MISYFVFGDIVKGGRIPVLCFGFANVPYAAEISSDIGASFFGEAFDFIFSFPSLSPSTDVGLFGAFLLSFSAKIKYNVTGTYDERDEGWWLAEGA